MKMFSWLLKILVVLAHLFALPALADDEKNQGDVDKFAITSTQGISMFSPEMFYSGALQGRFPELPEMEAVNSGQFNDVLFLERYLAQEGMALGLGVNPNRDSSFDLYAPFVGIVLDSPAEVFGEPDETEGGRMHFMTHDAVHLYAGIPGPRLEDMDNPEKLQAIKDRLVQVILDKEALASAWTARDYLSYYYNWRDARALEPAAREEYVSHNKGIFSAGEVSHDDVMTTLLTVAYRDSWKHFTTVNNFMDVNYVERAMKAGVPMLFPNMRFENKTLDNMAVWAQSRFFRALVPAASAIQFRERDKTGHTYQKAFAVGLTEFYYQPWFAKWATMFNIGLPIDEMEEQLNVKIEQYRKGEFMKDIPEKKEFQFEIAYTRNELSQFGRKVIELQEALKQVLDRDSSKEIARLDELLEQAVVLHKEIQKYLDSNEEFTAEALHDFQMKSYEIHKSAHEEFQVDAIQADGQKLLPDWARPPHSDFSNYWFDIFAYAIRRPDIMVAFVNAEGIMREMRKMNQDEAEAIRNGEEYVNVVEETEVKSAFMEQFLAQLYKQNNMLPSEVPTVDEAPGENEYLKRMHVFSMAIQEQVYSVALPQLMEFNQLSNPERRLVHDAITGLTTSVQTKIASLVNSYKNVYLKGNVSPENQAQVAREERNILTAVNNLNMTLYKAIGSLEEGKTYNAISDEMELLSAMKKNLESGQSVAGLPGTVAPLTVPRTQRTVSKACSAISSVCKFGSIRGKASGTSYGQLVQVDNNEISISGLNQFDHIEEDAAIVFMVNNDNSVLDVKVAQEVAKRLGVRKDYVLANEQMAEQQSALASLDRRVIVENSAGWQDKAIKKLAGKGRTSITVLPESQVPTYGAQMPLIAKTQGFEFARTVAKSLAGKKKVYAVTITTNGLEAATSRDGVEFKVDVTAAVPVPTHEVQGQDTWVEQQRGAFEAVANLGRAKAMTDLLNRAPIYQSNVPAASATRPRREFTDFFEQWNSEQRARACEKFFGIKL